MIPKRYKWGSSVYPWDQLIYSSSVLSNSLTDLKNAKYVRTIMDPAKNLPKVDNKIVG